MSKFKEWEENLKKRVETLNRKNIYRVIMSESDDLLTRQVFYVF